jgi:hypothetical protein
MDIRKKIRILPTIILIMLNNKLLPMLKRLFYLVMVAAIITSCGNKGPKNEVTQNVESTETIKVVFDTLVAHPEKYIGKTITIEGKVIHVCTETGKKMFITGQNPDVSLYIAAGDKISKFPMELLGSEITVEGMITRAPGAEMSEPDMKEGAMNEKHMAMTGDTCDMEKARSAQVSLSDIRMQYNSHTIK